MTNSAKLQQVTDGWLYSEGPVFCRNDHKIDFSARLSNAMTCQHASYVSEPFKLNHSVVIDDLFRGSKDASGWVLWSSVACGGVFLRKVL